MAEGSSRTYKSFSHFIDSALSLSFELEIQLFITSKRSYISVDKWNELQEKIENFKKWLWIFRTNFNDYSLSFKIRNYGWTYGYKY